MGNNTRRGNPECQFNRRSEEKYEALCGLGAEDQADADTDADTNTGSGSVHSTGTNTGDVNTGFWFQHRSIALAVHGPISISICVLMTKKPRSIEDRGFSITLRWQQPSPTRGRFSRHHGRAPSDIPSSQRRRRWRSSPPRAGQPADPKQIRSHSSWTPP